MKEPRILFMGTPEFAVPSLEVLVGKGYPVVTVVTQPDGPKGRGQVPAPPPVKVSALAKGLPILQPRRVRDPEFLRIFMDIAPDMVILVAFGQILPKEIIEFPREGCINVHPSLLPRFRGAAPINWTLIRGDQKTGVTILRMDEGVDSGDMLLQEETQIGPEENAGDLHDRLAEMGARMLPGVIEAILAGTARAVPQDAAMVTAAPKLSKEDGLIAWNAGVHDIVNLVRGLSPFPGAYSFLEGKMLKILAAEAFEGPVGGNPGRIGGPSERGLVVEAGNGQLYLREVQMEGRKKMPIHDFLRGYRLLPEMILR
jgi:methionyl-tRNA formyltransferase